MSTKLKIFSICCGMALATIFSTIEGTAKGPDGINITVCPGNSGLCGVAPDGTILIGTAVIMN
jgi:hypothetical protein